MRRKNDERGAAAVEMAIVTPVLIVLVFGIIAFGIGFLQLQTARGAVREGARLAAILKADGTRYSVSDVQNRTKDASVGLITSAGQVQVTACSAPGGQAIVTYNTAQANGGQGITIAIPMLPTMSMNQTVSAQFMCEG